MLVFASLPESVSRLFQRKSEAGNSECRYSSKKNAVLIKEDPLTAGEYKGPDGNTPCRFWVRFFGFIAAGRVGVIGYALLVRR